VEGFPIRHPGPWEQKRAHRHPARLKDWLFHAGVGLVSGAGLVWLLTDRQAMTSIQSAVGRGVSEISCNIKGNISVNGERIYHLPGQTYYSETQINSRRGERWFCSEQEAGAAGWRKAKR
jgi:hypothetical protein